MNYATIDLGLRAQLLTTVLPATGSATLSAVAAGFSRASGSFLADGFAVGMSIAATGFSAANNAEAVVSGVTATLLSVAGGRVAQTASSGRAVAAVLPAARIYEGGQYEPAPGVPFLETELVPEPSELIGGPAEGGTVEVRGLFVVRLFTPAGMGSLGTRLVGDAILERFTPGTTFPAGPDVVRVRGGLAPYSSALLGNARQSGHSLLPLTIPWRVYRRNVVAVAV